MPLPFIIGIGVAIAGTIGTAGAVAGACATYDAKKNEKSSKQERK